MHLTQFTDYSLRLLIYLGLKKDQATVSEVAEAFGISRNHLVKVAHHLSGIGFVQSSKGKSGGVRLAIPPERINIGEVVARSEPFALVECFNPATNTCPIMGCCDLEILLGEAKEAFLNRLRARTLADLLSAKNRRSKRTKLGL